MVILGTNIYEMTNTSINELGNINNIYDGLVPALNILVKRLPSHHSKRA